MTRYHSGMHSTICRPYLLLSKCFTGYLGVSHSPHFNCFLFSQWKMMQCLFAGHFSSGNLSHMSQSHMICQILNALSPHSLSLTPFPSPSLSLIVIFNGLPALLPAGHAHSSSKCRGAEQEDGARRGRGATAIEFLHCTRS